MNNYLKKIQYILKEEGFIVLSVRIARYFVYILEENSRTHLLILRNGKRLKAFILGNVLF